jgi:hypothetical protein
LATIIVREALDRKNTCSCQLRSNIENSLGSEDVDAIPFEVVNAKACRPEDRKKKAPTPPRRGRRPKKQTAQTGR